MNTPIYYVKVLDLLPRNSYYFIYVIDCCPIATSALNTELDFKLSSYK